MGKADEHPEQDPAEGSRETIERDLKRQEEKQHDSKHIDARHVLPWCGGRRAVPGELKTLLHPDWMVISFNLQRRQNSLAS